MTSEQVKAQYHGPSRNQGGFAQTKTYKIAGKEYPVLGTVTIKGCPVPLLSIKMMSDGRERELGARSAEKWKGAAV